MSKCKCTLRESSVGDGCQHCNPEAVIEQLREQVAEQRNEIERLEELLEVMALRIHAKILLKEIRGE